VCLCVSVSVCVVSVCIVYLFEKYHTTRDRVKWLMWESRGLDCLTRGLGKCRGLFHARLVGEQRFR
jgi:hypothetical protein